MADACARCGGKGWTWNGHRRVTCRLPHSPGHVQLISREEWPAVKEQLARARA